MLLDLLYGAMNEESVERLSESLGTDRKSTQSGIAAALPLIVSALARNASSDDGARSLANAISRDHDGSLLDQLNGFLKSGRTSDGEGILDHVFGDRKPAAANTVSRASGLDPGSAGQLLSMLAPIVMGALGRTSRNQKMSAGGLSSLLRAESEESGASSLLAMLDQDGDGSVMDEVMEVGSRLLGGFLGKK